MSIIDRTKEGLIKTMVFFDIFDFTLTKEELCDYILYKKCNLKQLQDFIDHQEFVLESNNYVYFRNRSITLKIRKDNETRAHKLIRKAKKYVKWMQILPFIRTVALCNSLSFYNAEKGSDIDLFIITENNRLYLARTFSWLFLQILGIRRHGTKVSGRFCLSFLISKDAMDIKSIKNEDDIYLTFWTRLLRPLLGQQTYREFIQANMWLKDHFDYEIDQQKHIIPESKVLLNIQQILEFPFKGWSGNIVENLLKKWQMSRSRKKAIRLENSDGIVIKDNMLKFHNVDMRKTYQKIFNLRFSHFARFLTSEADFENETLVRSRENRRLYEARFQDTDGMKSETHWPDSQKTQTPAD
jgi:hypothetical protein